MYDSKIAEFNFKVLHGILPCQMNLVKWKTETDKPCPGCNEEHDIMHHLYFCPFSRNLWNTVGTILKTNLTAKDTFLYDNLSMTFAISVTQSLLYKSCLIVKDTRKLQT